MKIRYIQNSLGHIEGDVIDTDSATALRMVRKGVCEYLVKDNNTKVNLPITDIDEVEKVVKRRGNPNFGKK